MVYYVHATRVTYRASVVATPENAGRFMEQYVSGNPDPVLLLSAHMLSIESVDEHKFRERDPSHEKPQEEIVLTDPLSFTLRPYASSHVEFTSGTVTGSRISVVAGHLAVNDRLHIPGHSDFNRRFREPTEARSRLLTLWKPPKDTGTFKGTLKLMGRTFRA